MATYHTPPYGTGAEFRAKPSYTGPSISISVLHGMLNCCTIRICDMSSGDYDSGIREADGESQRRRKCHEGALGGPTVTGVSQNSQATRTITTIVDEPLAKGFPRLSRLSLRLPKGFTCEPQKGFNVTYIL